LNRIIKAYLSILVKEEGRDWDYFLQSCAFVLRARFLSAVGTSPYAMLRGREPTLPSDVWFGTIPIVEASQENYGDELVERLAKAHDFSQQARSDAELLMKEQYDKDKKEVTFEAGQKVILFTDKFERGLRKLQTRMSLHTVVEQVSPVNVEIQCEKTGRVQTVHV
jgi:hypothetical protein